MHFYQGKIDRDTFIRALVVKLEQGGVEIEEKARRMSDIAEKLIVQSDDIRRFRAKKR